MTKQSVKVKTKSLSGIENCRVVEIGVGYFGGGFYYWKYLN